MEKLITVKDVSKRYGCSLPTARKYIRQCNPHMENPLTTYGWAFQDWEASRIVSTKSINRNVRNRITADKIIVPRSRT